jgi:membrane protease subunit (stomatin/prohibitin family)
VDLGEKIREGSDNAGTWPARYGLELASVAIENIEFSEQSRELVRQFSEKRMGMRAYEDVSQRAADISAQQLIAQGVRDNGLGDGGAMVFGMNLAGSLDPRNASVTAAAGVAGAASAAESAQSKGEQDKSSIDSQVETLKKLKELLDAGILTQEEFDAKKRQVLGL